VSGADVNLSVLSVAFPFAAVSPDAVGGAEQILSMLDRALVAAGHRSIVLGPQGSRVAGELIPMPDATGSISHSVRDDLWARYRAGIEQTCSAQNVDLIHCHGLDYNRYLPGPGLPLLATLHLPIPWYEPGALAPRRPSTWVHGVSSEQRLEGQHVLQPIENGVPVDGLSARYRKRDFALVLARICPEKGVHLAIHAAQRADMPLIIAGQVFDYGPHIRYFEEQVRPLLGDRCRFVGPVTFRRKRRLLTAARCLLVPSVVPETSSLAAREALACGTPVIGFPHGALMQVVQSGRTGFLVGSVEEMADAINECRTIDSSHCRSEAMARFADCRMVQQYLDRYRYLTGLACSVQPR
jgi:glycosyltransferase involved in cell wall biosynthesis